MFRKMYQVGPSRKQGPRLAMRDADDEPPLQYRLIFDRRHAVNIVLLAPALFDFQAKGRHFITREEANEYERRTRVARLQDAAHDAIAAASQYDPNYNYGYPPGQPWQ